MVSGPLPAVRRYRPSPSFSNLAKPSRLRLLSPKRCVSLLVVNLLGVSLPLIVRNAVDALHGGFALNDVLLKAGLIIALATVMGLVRLWSRILVFGVGRQVETDLKQRIFDHLLLQEPSTHACQVAVITPSRQLNFGASEPEAEFLACRALHGDN